MMLIRKEFLKFCSLLFLCSCGSNGHQAGVGNGTPIIIPKVVTEAVRFDSDDPAIWYNKEEPENSLILGTDKHEDGALYVFDLDGNIIEDKTIRGLKRPNNVDIRKVKMGGEKFHIAAVTERMANKLRVFRVPEMEPIDNMGIELFEGEEDRDPMGVSLYVRESDDQVFAIVSRKTGPSGKYLWQYSLDLDDDGNIVAEKVREFGTFSGNKEIEAIAVDDELGYLYYSDEGFGVRKYHADPDMGDGELAVFATEGFKGDHEGISFYKLEIGTGYILVSDQQSNKFHVFPREGTKDNPHEHTLLKSIEVQAKESDGSETTSSSFGDKFPNGLFVAMSTDKTFHLYDWADIAGDELKIAPDGVPLHSKNAIEPKVITEQVEFDSDDPAIWIHPEDPEKSLIVGTDKLEGGGLYVFDLDGKIVNKITSMGRPNNVDVAYGLKLGGKSVDIAVATERNTDMLRVFSMPDLKPIDGGGLPVFEGESMRDPMGIAIYTRPSDGEIFAVVGRKDGPSGTYIWQYHLKDAGNGTVTMEKVREFGEYSGVKEIEAIVVDNELGYIYYSDEVFGIRKYHADPEKGNEELALFGTKDFGRDIEGLSIYKLPDGTGYILASDQQLNKFQIYTREGSEENPHDHKWLKEVEVKALHSDGSEVSSTAFGGKFPNGLFVVMSTDQTFHLYDWEDIAGAELKVFQKLK
ncbi:phytase [Belliella marina]|uniref:Phytase n=1 Tax=Belliella marina TaxID=1644146 RepID=A0ABW4VLZ0_9BACT